MADGWRVVTAELLREAAVLMRERAVAANACGMVSDCTDPAHECRADDDYFDLDGDPISPEDTHAIGSAFAVARVYLGRES